MAESGVVVREVRAKITAQDASAAGVESFDHRIEKLREDVGKPMAIGREADVQKSVDAQIHAMELGAKKVREAEERESVRREARQRLFGPDPVARGPLPLSTFVPSLGDIESAAGFEAIAMLDQQKAKSLAAIGKEMRPLAYAAGASAGAELGRGIGDESEKTGIARINELFGRGSFASKVLKLIKGSGPILALNLGASIFEHVGEGVDDFAKRLGEGKIKGTELAIEFAKTIPIVGKLVNGSESFLGALTGSTFEAAKLATEMEKVNAAQEKIRTGEKHIDETLQPLIDRPQTSGLDDYQREKVLADKAKQDDLKQINDAKSELEKLEEQLRQIPLRPEGANAKHVNFQRGMLEGEIENRRELIEKAEAKAAADAEQRDNEVEDNNVRRTLQEQAAYKKSIEEKKKADEDWQEHATRGMEEYFKDLAEEEKEDKRRLAQREAHEQETYRSLHDLKNRELELSGKLSDTDERRLRISEQFADQRRELNKILQDESATADQKAEAQGILDQSRTDEQNALAKIGQRPLASTAQGGNAGGLTGLLEQSQVNANRPVDETAKNTKKTADESAKTNTLMAQLITTIATLNATPFLSA